MLKKMSLTVLFLLTCLVFATMGVGASEVLNVLGWADYIAPEVSQSFKTEFGVDLKYTNVLTYGDLLKELTDNPGKYDVIITGEYIIPTLLEQNLISPLNKDYIPNFKNLDIWFTNRNFDPNNRYTVPYLYIYFGLAYNKEVLTANEVSLQTFFEAPEKLKGRIVTFPDERIVIGFALRYIGKSVNSDDPADLGLVKMLLQNLKQNATPDSWDMSRQVTQAGVDILQGKADLAIFYAFDQFFSFKEFSSKIGYVIPEEGGVFGMDNLAVVNGSNNGDVAHKFINFMLRPEIAAKTVTFFGIPSPVEGVKNLISQDLASNPCLYPPLKIAKNYEFLKPLNEEELQIYKNLWQEIK